MTSDDAPSHPQSENYTVQPEDTGERLDRWLANQRPDMTRSRLKALIKEGNVADGADIITDPSLKVQPGRTFHLTVPAPEPATPQPEAIPLDVLFEDKDVIVVNKPPGLVVHPAAGNWNGTLVNALLAHCGEELSGIGGVTRPGIVHRLDKDTSGALIVAKNDLAHQGLSRQFAAHDLERLYEAIVLGAPRPGFGVVDAPLARSGGDRKKMAVSDSESAKHAVTHFRTLAAYGRSRAKLAGDALVSRVECRLETGRTHQIRVHLSHLGHPVLGDPVYGRTGVPGLAPTDSEAEHALQKIRKFRRQALHARTLTIQHPVNGGNISVDAPFPKDWRDLISAIEAL